MNQLDRAALLERLRAEQLLRAPGRGQVVLQWERTHGEPGNLEARARPDSTKPSPL